MTVAAIQAAPQLDDASYLRYRDALTPKTSEMAWRDVGWRPSLWAAVAEAQSQDKPILLWAMNGHPLGCT